MTEPSYVTVDFEAFYRFEYLALVGVATAVTGDKRDGEELVKRPRTVLALYFAGEYTSGEIATILDVPEGTVRSDIARARVAVMRALEG